MVSSEELRKRAFTELNLASRGERESWLQHPCSRALLYTLRADELDLKESWASGSYCTEHEYGTIQLNSTAIGEVQHIQTVLDFVEGINDEDMFEESDDD